VALELPELVSKRLANQGEVLLVFGALRAGDAVNVIPSHAELRGTFRTPFRQAWDAAEGAVAASLVDLLAGTGAKWHLDYRRGIPPVVNTPAETEQITAAAREVVGERGVIEAPQSLGGDSFAWYLEMIPGSYARLGVHDPRSADERLDLHSSTFDIDERAIDVGVELLVRTALNQLR
jgi:amidohydrolase